MNETTKKKVVSGKTTVRLPEDVHHRAKMAAVQLKMSVQDFVAEAVEAQLEAMASATSNSKPKRKQA